MMDIIFILTIIGIIVAIVFQIVKNVQIHILVTDAMMDIIYLVVNAIVVIPNVMFVLVQQVLVQVVRGVIIYILKAVLNAQKDVQNALIQILVVLAKIIISNFHKNAINAK